MRKGPRSGKKEEKNTLVIPARVADFPLTTSEAASSIRKEEEEEKRQDLSVPVRQCTITGRVRQIWSKRLTSSSEKRMKRVGYSVLLLVLSLVALIQLAQCRPPSHQHNKNNNNNLWKDSSSTYSTTERFCQPDHLTVYRVVLTTFWNEQKFPKHFPQWRPPAQWSKLVGKSRFNTKVEFVFILFFSLASSIFFLGALWEHLAHPSKNANVGQEQQQICRMMPRYLNSQYDTQASEPGNSACDKTGHQKRKKKWIAFYFIQTAPSLSLLLFFLRETHSSFCSCDACCVHTQDSFTRREKKKK